MDTTDTVTAPEAATILGVTRQRVSAMLKRGKMHGEQVDGAWRIPRAEVDRRLRERRKFYEKEMERVSR